MSEIKQELVKVDKLVHGGQGIGQLADGRKVFLWNALPGETVQAALWRRKKTWAEGMAEVITEPSAHRIAPQEPDSYLGTSPWQIMDYTYENEQKQQILRELFEHEGLTLPAGDFKAPDPQYGYRNKMEYSFWADENGLHLALFNRGSHQKHIVHGSALAMPAIDLAASDIIADLNRLHIRGSQLKCLVLRCNQAGETVGALFVKDPKFPTLELPSSLQGLVIYYSNPKSPAAVITEELSVQGSLLLSDMIAATANGKKTADGRTYQYDVNSFFQVNLPIYETALQAITTHVVPELPLVDMYAGVGSIGLSVAHKDQTLTLVELDAASAAMARQNAGEQATIVEASSEKALEQVVADVQVIVDPPRAGLHPKLVARFNEVLPPRIIYLSCNPATQARDVKLLSDNYQITFAEGYNFFPRTPHIESLLVLERRNQS